MRKPAVEKRSRARCEVMDMMKSIRSLQMNDGTEIPQLGLGVMSVPRDMLPSLTCRAVDLGYRRFDTATHYGNEAELGEGLARVEIDRDEIRVSTKVPDGMHGFDATLRAFDASEKALGRIDLYLIHWPQPAKKLYRETWRALVLLQAERRVRSIGVANFPPALIQEIADDTGILPAVNQIELHPRFQQPATRAFNSANGILTEAWSPLENGRVLAHPLIVDIAERRGRSPAQVVLRWHLQSGFVVIPKAANGRHLADNLAAASFSLDEAEMMRIATLDTPSSAFGIDPMLRQSDRGRI